MNPQTLKELVHFAAELGRAFEAQGCPEGAEFTAIFFDRYMLAQLTIESLGDLRN